MTGRLIRITAALAVATVAAVAAVISCRHACELASGDVPGQARPVAAGPPPPRWLTNPIGPAAPRRS
jgi:hypothetical protein